VEGIVLPQGTLLAERYRIGTAVGYGGFALAYRARDERLERDVIVKEYLPRMLVNRVPGEGTVRLHQESERTEYLAGKEDFLQEARLLAGFREETGIIPVFDSFEQHETAYFVMGRADGVSLDAYLRRLDGKVPYARALGWLNGVMKSLAVVHAAGILHRDINPDNLILTEDDRLQLADFGSARPFVDTGGETVSVLIKDGFAPLEQYSEHITDQGPWTDIYALATTLYRMITGQMPLSAFERLQGSELQPPSALGADLPESAEQALMQALSLRWQDRQPDVASFTQALSSQNTEKRTESMTEKLSGMTQSMPGFIRERNLPSHEKPIRRISVILGLLFILIFTTAMILRFTPIWPELLPLNGFGKLMPAVPGTEENILSFADPRLDAAILKALDEDGRLDFLQSANDGKISTREAMRVTVLEIADNAIISLDGLQAFGNLKTLDIGGNSVTDLSPLAGMHALRNLILHDNPIRDLTPLAGLNALEELELLNNPVVDLTPLQGLTRMKQLSVAGTGAVDLKPLAGMKELTVLSLDGTMVSDLSVLSGLSNLRRLTLQNTEVSDLSPLAGLVRLRELLLAASRVTNPNPIRDLYPSLQQVDFQLK